MKWREIRKQYPDLLRDIESKNPYEILRVSKSASLDEIKTAYRKLVRTYHPDGSHAFMKSTNEEIVKRINVAYEKILNERNG